VVGRDAGRYGTTGQQDYNARLREMEKHGSIRVVDTIVFVCWLNNEDWY